MDIASLFIEHLINERHLSFALKVLKGGVFVLRKTASILAALSIVSTSLVACNADNNAMDTRYNDAAQPIGYYTNDRNDDNIDNEGPITEMFDGVNDRNDHRRIDYRNNYSNRAPLTVNDRNRAVQHGKFSREDYNYHGHIGNNITENGKLAERISDQVAKLANVEDVNTLVTDNNVVVAVDTNDRNNENVENKVKNVVQQLARGKNVNVVTDEATFTRVRNINNGLTNGDRMDNDIRDLFEDIGDAFEEPFDGNR